MCGRYTLRTPLNVLMRQFNLSAQTEWQLPLRYNIAPTQTVAVILATEQGRELEMMRWGLIPSWAKKASEGARMINARAETVASTPAFRSSFTKRRCILPADGFYEWDRAGGTKQPYLLRPPEDGVLAMAGVWAVWKDPATGLWVPSAAVITTEANGAVGRIHDRMPVLLPRDAWARWLDPATPDPSELLGLLVPAPDDVLALIPVSKAVNNVRNDSPDLLIPLADLPPAPLPAPAPEGPTQGTLFD